MIHSPEQVQRRGFFRPEVVQRLVDEHLSKKQDHTIRLWSLLMFELWCQIYLDRQQPGLDHSVAKVGKQR